MPGVVWAGTDDGNVQVSRDGGRDVHRGRQEPAGPAGRITMYWISRIDASHFDPGTAYVVGRRSSQRRPEAVRLRHARLRHDLAEHRRATCRPYRQRPGRFARIRRTRTCCTSAPSSACSSRSTAGKAWQKFMNNFPTVRIGRHPRPSARRRSDRRDARPQRLDRRRHHAAAAAHAGGRDRRTPTLFDIRPAVAWLNDRQSGQQVGGQKSFVGENAPRGAAINYYLKSAAAGDVKITIADVTGRVDPHDRRPEDAGHQPRQWNLAPTPAGGPRAAGAAAVAGAAAAPASSRAPTS